MTHIDVSALLRDPYESLPPERREQLAQAVDGLLNAAREVVEAFQSEDVTVTRAQNNALGRLAGFVAQADKPSGDKSE